MKKTHIVLLIFLVVVLAAVISTVYQADTYSSFEIAKANPGKEFHIIGTLDKDKPVEESIMEKSLILTFYMTDDKGNSSKVHFYGSEPTDFYKSDQIVLIGKYENDVFIASSLLLKCPSKYNPDEFEEQEFTADSE
ncbi:MAG: cytochrome c maturation protein CcmE [Bacteroidota bacterium]